MIARLVLQVMHSGTAPLMTPGVCTPLAFLPSDAHYWSGADQRMQIVFVGWGVGQHAACLEDTRMLPRLLVATENIPLRRWVLG